ncbi:hypothetical protein QF045_000157 [Pseudomonas sp. W4I3]|nr:hypothetical protein [Pseudomonas sp. W4I3]
MACSSLSDFIERDLNNVANTARILVQNLSDVFRVIEHRGFDKPIDHPVTLYAISRKA